MPAPHSSAPSSPAAWAAFTAAVHGGNEALPIRIQSVDGAQVAMLQGAPVREPFVHQGPFVMSTLDEIEAVKAAHAAGELGALE